MLWTLYIYDHFCGLNIIWVFWYFFKVVIIKYFATELERSAFGSPVDIQFNIEFCLRINNGYYVIVKTYLKKKLDIGAPI